MAESTVGWFGVIQKYCSLADKPWLISQIRPSEQAANIDPTACYMHFAINDKFLKRCCLIFGLESYFTPPGFIPHVALLPCELWTFLSYYLQLQLGCPCYRTQSSACAGSTSVTGSHDWVFPLSVTRYRKIRFLHCMIHLNPDQSFNYCWPH